MNNPDLVKLGKFLSLILRHKPEIIGIQLDPQGWVDVTTLLSQCQAHGKPIDELTLQTIVATNNKNRYRFSEDGKRIRANQGHSVSISLDYEAVRPPAHLYHGTAERFLDSILKNGLHKQQRHHVHLSGDLDTAGQVGRRHGKLVILTVDAEQMHLDGHHFFQTPNGVWLTEHVPSRYFKHISK